MSPRYRLCLALGMSLLPLSLTVGQPAGKGTPAGKEAVLFDFEDPAEVAAWKPLELPKAKEPPPRVERSGEHATSGRHSLKIVFKGGRWPAVITTRVPPDWDAYHTFHADVTVSRPCVVGFAVLQEKSQRGGDWDGAVSRWTKTAILRPGKHHISGDLHPNGWSAVRTKLENGRVLGKVVSLEIFAYAPADGETIFVDNIRLSPEKEKPAPPPRTRFRVLGTDWEVSGVQELGKKLKGRWVKPAEKSVAEVEAEFRALHARLKKDRPRAVLAVFRDGEKGHDPALPERVYSGWRDAYWSSHGPDGMTVERSTNFGRHASQEIFMRHRSPLMRVDLTSVPPKSDILAARLVVVRTTDRYNKDHNPHRPNMWVAEACNRPWEETEVNAYEYARGKFWRAVGGMHWDGPDPDFLPLYLAHGPSQGRVNTWDFTHAVRYWTDGKHPNHGFMLHGDSHDWIRAWYREAPNVKDRPALLVIYEPPAG
jgi:hypothetical protein